MPEILYEYFHANEHGQLVLKIKYLLVANDKNLKKRLVWVPNQGRRDRIKSSLYRIKLKILNS